MSITGMRLCPALFVPIAVGPAYAQQSAVEDLVIKNLCGPVTVTEPVCSYTALNTACNVFINRFSPVAPPTIYARHGAVISVTVMNQSPFEQLTLDLKSLAAQVPPDQLANGFAAISGVLGSFAIVEAGSVGVQINAVEPLQDSTERIIADQKALADTIKTDLPEDAQRALKMLKVVLLPFPAGVCQGRDRAQNLEPWLDTNRWLQTVKGRLQTAKSTLSDPSSDRIGAISRGSKIGSTHWLAAAQTLISFSFCAKTRTRSMRHSPVRNLRRFSRAG